MFLSTNTCDGKRDCIKSAIFMEDMLWTEPNVMAVECVCTTVLPVT